MTARTSARFTEGFVARGKSFDADNEENARLYEERGLAEAKKKPKKADKQAEPERTQDVGPAKKTGGPKRSRKNYTTKAEDD